MKKVLIVSVLLVAIFCIYILIVAGFMIYGAKQQATTEPDTILVLGAKVEKNAPKPSKTLKARLDAAYRYHKEHPDTIIITSGGQGENEYAAEADVMKHYLVKKGVPENKIKTEAQSTRTEENLRFSKEKYTLGNTVIVTSNYHLYRALFLAEQEGIQATGVPAKSYSLKGYCREVLSISYAWIFDR
ncbi:YdcF family protein [Listeria ilorinensis]|uniref:YdcF family protein n=1 Tax=Listeria ilorinensis TaxID=2867439 RepID=UPI001EF530A8|nr:YdcF family protein [Listeria ilorinensis]